MVDGGRGKEAAQAASQKDVADDGGSKVAKVLQPKTDVDKLFATLDKDQSGTVDLDEFCDRWRGKVGAKLFEGTWIGAMGEVTIDGDVLIMKNGVEACLNFPIASIISYAGDNGSLREGKLHWANGDVWRKLDATLFEGTWRGGMGQVTIFGNRLHLPNGNKVEVTYPELSVIAFAGDEGRIVDGRLEWANGDVWIEVRNGGLSKRSFMASSSSLEDIFEKAEKGSEGGDSSSSSNLSMRKMGLPKRNWDNEILNSVCIKDKEDLPTSASAGGEEDLDSVPGLTLRSTTYAFADEDSGDDAASSRSNPSLHSV